MDVKTAFLNRVVEEEVYCNVPDLASLGNIASVCVGSKVYNI
jgi:hypothetical protein